MQHMVERLDDWGRPAWIGLMVVSFVLFWPLGLVVLAFLIGSGRMACMGHHGRWSGEDRRQRFERKMAKLRERYEQWGPRDARAGAFAPSGNRAFDEYRTDVMKRLEEEATDFRSFLDRLRMAKDKAEFDQFMAERRAPPANPFSGSPPGDAQPPART